MRTRKQLPAFGYLDNVHIDIDALISYLDQNNLLSWDRYLDVKASTNGAFTGFIKANQWTLDNFFKEPEAPSLESERFRQIQLTEFDKTKSKGQVVVKPTTIFERVKRQRVDDPRYVPEADDLNYGLRTELVKGEIEKIFDLFTSRITRARLAYLGPGHEIKPHFDYDPSYVCRFHIPVLTDPAVKMWVERQGVIHEQHLPADGRVYFFNAGFKHWVKNNSNKDRVHLIVDVHGQQELDHLVTLDR
jgi:hypothetical protein